MLDAVAEAAEAELRVAHECGGGGLAEPPVVLELQREHNAPDVPVNLEIMQVRVGRTFA